MTLEIIDYFSLAKSAGLTDEQAKKYKEYAWRKKRQINIADSTHGRDSYRQRVYDAECAWENKLYREYINVDPREVDKTGRPMREVLCEEYRAWKRFETLEDAQKFVNRITKSKTWKKLDTDDTSEHQNSRRLEERSKIKLEFLPRHSKFAGLAMIREGVIKLSRGSGLTKSVILHELAHMVGFGSYTHGIKFRQWNVALVRRFMGRYEGDELYKAYRKAGLKMTINYKIKTPREWLKVSTPVYLRGKQRKVAKL